MRQRGKWLIEGRDRALMNWQRRGFPQFAMKNAAGWEGGIGGSNDGGAGVNG